MRRRFVHLVANHVIPCRRAYKLHLIDPSRFFYPTRPSSGSADDGSPMEEFQLPPAAMTFYGPSEQGHLGSLDFMPLGQSCKKGIIGVDLKCRTIHCDAAALAVSTMPEAHAAKSQPISVPVGDGVYVLQRNPVPYEDDECVFEALIHGRGPESRCSPDWYWRPLPPPPFALDPSYGFGKDFSNLIDGHTLVGGHHIWVSAGDAGTYSFSTVAGTWSKVANWAMPFSGRAEYIPELNTSLGFSSQDNQLCASDLAAASSFDPPKLLGKWEDVAQPKDWIPVMSSLVPLGSGKLFIAKFFETREKRYMKDDFFYSNSKNILVFTGVELERAGGKINMWKHKSMRYTIDGMRLHWVI
ncbi:hypothetical protein ACP70R_049924 [Stipagrostis hirtigluma subsp. patula]